MSKIQSGHDVLSLFGMVQYNKALPQSLISRQLLVSLISAFFIVIAVGLLLRLSTNLLSNQSTVEAAPLIEQSAAYLPGQLVSEKLSQGYFRF
ncbi:MAG: hypothetical protein HUU49_04745 [Candidatus Buchananbacteria bacterium]|nr:hypothetical protein [Candidatus Buchananbacteria bacterium]